MDGSSPVFDVEAHAERLRVDGYTVIEDFMDAATLEAVRAGLAPHLDAHRGRNDFEGFKTERVYTLVGRGRVFERTAEDARVLALLWLNALRVERRFVPQRFRRLHRWRRSLRVLLRQRRFRRAPRVSTFVAISDGGVEKAL